MGDPIIDGSDVLSMGLSMVIVIGAVVGLGWLYSRLKFNATSAGNLIDVVASRGLGPKERLLLVQVADQQLLIGVTATQVRTLHTFDKPVAAEALANVSSGFARRLRIAARGTAK